MSPPRPDRRFGSWSAPFSLPSDPQSTIGRVVVIGYKPWLARHVGVVLVSLILVVVGQHEALTYNRAERTLVFAPRQVPALSGVQLADVRLANPGGGATGREPPDSRAVSMASAVPGSGGDDRWSVML